jgi:hypothetical protein
MRSNGRLQRVLEIRQLGGAASAAATPEPTSALINDLRLFALTFAGGFLFTTIFLA